jgi:hypothetical protein
MLLEKDGNITRTAVRAGDTIFVDWKNKLLKFGRRGGRLTWRNGDDKALMRHVLGLDRIVAEIILRDMLDIAGLKLSAKVRDEPTFTVWMLEAHEG